MSKFLPKIKVFSGTMFSGKSTALMNDLNRYQLAGYKTMLLKPIIDKRYSEQEVVSHNGIRMKAIPIDTKGDYGNIILMVQDEIENNGINVLGIDEVQFFSQDIIGIIEYFVNSLGITVVVAGLDMDYLGRPFGPVPNLMAIADDVKKFKAVCKECGDDAIFEYRTDKNDDLVDIGSQDKYIPLCRKCYNKKFSSSELI